MKIKNIVVVLSSVAVAVAMSCSNAAPRRILTGAAGTPGAAGAGNANGAAGAGNANGAAGAGNANGAAGDSSIAGTTGAAGDSSVAGTTGAAGDTSGTAGTPADASATGAAGTPADASTTGAAGTPAVMTCMNNTTPSTGNETNCPAKSGWVATASPVNKGVDQIKDNQLLPPYAIDGDPTTRYSSGVTPGTGPVALPFYFQVDMGAAKMVSGITVTETAATDTSLGYTVQLSTDGTTFTTVASCMYMAAATEVVSFTPTLARYVRYTDEMARIGGDTSWWSIHEFDISCN